MTATELLPPHVLTDPDHIVVRGVHKTYPGAPIRVLDDIDLVIARGSFVSLIGPSGCGKSTLLRAVAGLEPIDGGELTIFGATPEEACGYKAVGLVPQTPALLPWRTVAQNVSLPARVNRRAEHRRAARYGMGGPARTAGGVGTAELLDLVGLADRAKAYPSQLSGGMQQRVAIARAFGLEPDVLLMDEPFSALDEFTREAMRLHLLHLWQRMQTTVLFVTHSVREAVTLSDRVVVMSARPGRIHEVIDVDLPRPRDREVLADARLHEVEDRVRDSLQDAWDSGAKPADLVPA
ncbi:ABC transporter ATP-binding protein [Cellulomonas soli]|uniref:Nitrate ABC transporter ATPase n=1 Tax=Cellulomonas soli TaxID=931535 RepID=A0A512PHL0_9CELL|nr:ABC transporter ATP-binding protein [Cellulomonas soli]NYI59179.1 NitT/TauT family transport system ATP-binding protein [Cellulomonas soli]GEP70684.1 nitrate ABC transporter ATPase [Cellulomonas soli]